MCIRDRNEGEVFLENEIWFLIFYLSQFSLNCINPLVNRDVWPHDNRLGCKLILSQRAADLKITYTFENQKEERPSFPIRSEASTSICKGMKGVELMSQSCVLGLEDVKAEEISHDWINDDEWEASSALDHTTCHAKVRQRGSKMQKKDVGYIFSQPASRVPRMDEDALGGPDSGEL
eukprot:TRINITY_DN802_c0_g1_i11.p1 TRINITY_DN802_c0_g1~~TRINITY_DN802_c0_g1_i11.p1  ORF type:complete len:177 (-),score=4.62 TRINITY_DN802_c0_g1_i11:932-1462(-)